MLYCFKNDTMFSHVLSCGRSPHFFVAMFHEDLQVALSSVGSFGARAVQYLTPNLAQLLEDRLFSVGNAGFVCRDTM